MTERKEEIGRGTLENIVEMIEARRAAEQADDDRKREDAEREIHESPLSVEVRSTGWRSPGDQEAAKPDEYRILMTWGGPAVQVTGDLDEYGEPENARIEGQDWFQPWTALELTEEEGEALLEFARCFYFAD